MEQPIVESEALAQEQKTLSNMVIIPDAGYFPKPGDVFVALDIQYQGDDAHVAGDVWAWPKEHLGTYAGLITVTVPYVPSYFCFREGPPLLALVRRLSKECKILPKFLVIDGHGIAHPRKFGVACWLGIALNLPTIGCAKDTLIHYDALPEKQRGQTREVLLNQEPVGYIVSTQDDTRPIYVSPGHLVSLADSAKIALELAGNYRIPDPIRNADHAAREHAKGINDGTWKDLGTLEPILPWWKEK